MSLHESLSSIVCVVC